MIVDAPSRGLVAFATDVGEQGAVTVVGGRTQWDVGGEPASGTREVRAPSGVLAFEPAEMTVRVGAGTTAAALDAELAARGQCVALPESQVATVGGLVSVGHSDVRRLGRGPLRDAVLEVRYVSAEGHVVKAGGPTVKNVSGFDLCRLLVGSLGTLGLLGELVFRTRPRPAASQWLGGQADPFELHRQLFRPASILWNGHTTWVLLEGREGDVERGIAALEVEGLRRAASAPDLPAYRWSIDPARVRTLVDEVGGPGLEGTGLDRPGSFVAEVGVGVVHANTPPPAADPPAAVVALTRRLKALFDPTGRLNPGREVHDR